MRHVPASFHKHHTVAESRVGRVPHNLKHLTAKSRTIFQIKLFDGSIQYGFQLQLHSLNTCGADISIYTDKRQPQRPTATSTRTADGARS